MTARKEVGGVVDRLALRGDLHGAGGHFAARAEEPAHDGIFDRATNLVGIEAQADHGVPRKARTVTKGDGPFLRVAVWLDA